jgi:translocation and assembly module TamA
VEIQIEGVKGELLDNVLAYLSIEQQKNHPRLSASRIKRLHKQAPEEIKKALEPFGYYRADITTAELIPLSSNDDEAVWQAKYVIKLGEPLKITKVLIGGSAKDEKVFQKQFDDFPIKVGDTLNHPNYEKAKRVLRNLAEEYGYFDAKFTKQEIRIDEQAYTAEILLDFESNRRYIFGPVTFNQEQYSFNESLLRRFLTFKSGDYYIGSKILNFQNALSNSDYFQEVDVDIAHASPTGDLHLPINVTLKPRKKDKYAAGIGYGTDTGVRGSLSFQRRYINHYGHQFSAKTELSEIRRSATARYFIPMGLHPDSFLTITAGYKDESTDTSESEVFLVGISQNHTRRFFDKPLSEVIGIEYRDEKYAIGSDTGHAKLLMPNINWSYVDADNRIYTLNGYKIQLDVRGALNDVGSNTSFLQTRLNTTFIHQLLEDGRIIARGDIGYSAISLLSGDFHDLPPSIRFFAGGDRSVRGYDYQTLGPKNLEGQVIGGKNLLVGSIEYDHKILDKWSLAIFYDVGNAFNGFSEPLKQGAGVGVRWHSPVGLIRVDVATALSEEGRPWRLHITIGPDL